tara:strand:- start:181 stop:732 length:552 start_codon:yes stop_codon:yes gene_type:complete
MADEITLEVNEVEETTEAPPIQYTKTGRVKKPQSDAQKAALLKAREAYAKKQLENRPVRKETEIALAENMIKKQTERIEKIKAKMPKPKKEEPVVEPVVEPEPPPPEPPPEDPPEPPPIVRQKVKSHKKPVIIVEQNSDSDSQEEQNDVIFIKRRPKKKETPKQVLPNPFATAFRFYDRNAMS